MDQVRKLKDKVQAPIEDARAFMIESRKVVSKVSHGRVSNQKAPHLPIYYFFDVVGQGCSRRILCNPDLLVCR